MTRVAERFGPLGPGRRRVVLALGLAVVLVVGVALWAVRALGGPEGDLARAAEVSPAASQRLSFTDWAGVRAERGADLDADSSGAAVRRFLDEAYRSDLVSTSATVASAEALQEQFGLSPGTVEWEGFSQSTDGAVVSLQLPEDADLDALGERLAGLGFARPDEADGVWQGGADLLARLDPAFSPVFGYVVLLADEGLVLTSDSAAYLRTARASATGEASGMLDEVADVVGPLPDALSAAVYTGTYACGELAMTTADEVDQASGDRLVDEAGGVHPLTSFAMARVPGGDVRTVLGLETADAAREDADPRARLASGEAPGQGGSFRDRFRLEEVVADGRAVVMDMSPRRGQLVVSDLSTGPLLFAAC